MFYIRTYFFIYLKNYFHFIHIFCISLTFSIAALNLIFFILYFSAYNQYNILFNIHHFFCNFSNLDIQLFHSIQLFWLKIGLLLTFSQSFQILSSTSHQLESSTIFVLSTSFSASFIDSVSISLLSIQFSFSTLFQYSTHQISNEFSLSISHFLGFIQ